MSKPETDNIMKEIKKLSRKDQLEIRDDLDYHLWDSLSDDLKKGILKRIGWKATR